MDERAREADVKIPWWISIPAVGIGGSLLVARRLALPEDLDWDTAARPGRLIDIDGYRVHYVEEGAATSGGRPTLVLIHGFGGHTFSYRHIIHDLAADYRCIAVDLKGYGYSERRADAGLSHTDQVAMLARLLDRLGVDRAALVGHSMGGAVVQRFAAAHPDRVEALVLAAAVTGDEHAGRRPLSAPVLLRPVLPILAGVAARGILRSSFYDPSRLTAEIREEYVRPVRIKGSMDGLLAMMRDSSERDGPIDRSRITAPVLLLYGANDKIVPLTTARTLQQAIPHARLHVVDRAGHLLLEERPDECISAIRGFLADARVGSATAVR